MSIIADIHAELDTAGLVPAVESRPFKVCSVDYRTKLESAITKAFGRDPECAIEELGRLEQENERLESESREANAELYELRAELERAQMKIIKLEKTSQQEGASA